MKVKLIVRSNNFGIIYPKEVLNDFTAKENIYHGIATNRNESLKLAEMVMRKLKLNNRSDHFHLNCREVRTMIAIARALINSPNVVIADEPSGNLDHKTAKQFFNILFNLKSKDRIIIYATHNRYFANLADCRLQLINGKLKSTHARK